MSHRIAKINELISQQLSEIFTRELSLKPGVFLTVSKVDTSADLRYTRVFVSIFPESETRYAQETLRKEQNRIQNALFSRMHIKIVPKITFEYDTTEVEAQKIEDIFKEIEKEQEEE